MILSKGKRVYFTKNVYGNQFSVLLTQCVEEKPQIPLKKSSILCVVELRETL